MVAHNISQLRGAAIGLALALLTTTLVGACTDDMRSPDQERADQLLPNRNEYADSNLHTQAQTKLVAGLYDSRLDLIYYDADRVTPRLYFTSGEATVPLSAKANGSILLRVVDFHTYFMPLYMSIDMNLLLTDTPGDTIRLAGKDGAVHTSDHGKTIGLPLPESDDAEMEGFYIKSKGEIYALIDLMLPVPMKIRWHGKKQTPTP